MIRIERTIPLWGVIWALGVVVTTGTSVVWHVADMAHDIAAMREVAVEIRSEMKEQGAACNDRKPDDAC